MPNRALKMMIRCLFALVGVFLVALAASLLLVTGGGIDPFTSANIAVSDQLGIDLGPYQVAFNLLFVIPILIFARHLIGIGSAMNMFLVGYFVQWLTAVLPPLTVDEVGIGVTVVAAVAGIALVGVGASMYTTAGLGMAPYDALAPMLSERLRVPYRIARVGQDATFVGCSLVLSGPIGVSTIAIIFLAGPLIHMFNPVFERFLGKALRSPVSQGAGSVPAP